MRRGWTASARSGPEAAHRDVAARSGDPAHCAGCAGRRGATVAGLLLEAGLVAGIVLLPGAASARSRRRAGQRRSASAASSGAAAGRRAGPWHNRRAGSASGLATAGRPRPDHHRDRDVRRIDAADPRGDQDVAAAERVAADFEGLQVDRAVAVADGDRRRAVADQPDRHVAGAVGDEEHPARPAAGLDHPADQAVGRAHRLARPGPPTRRRRRGWRAAAARRRRSRRSGSAPPRRRPRG